MSKPTYTKTRGGLFNQQLTIEKRHTPERIVPRARISHVTHMNESCRTGCPIESAALSGLEAGERVGSWLK